MIVVDASVAVKWYVDEPGHDAALAFLRSETERIAPDFALLEVINVLRRKQRIGTFSQQQLLDAIEHLGKSFDRLLSAKAMLPLAVNMSRSLDHSVYDCAYLACALIEDTQLVTADAVFALKVDRSNYSDRIIRLSS